jgi:MFS family permease
VGLNPFLPNARTIVDVEARRASVATAVAFAASGFALASWLARIPQLRDQLHLDPSSLGLVLLSVSAGAVLALPLSGPIVARFGSRRTVAGAAVLFAAGLAAVAVGSTVGVTPVAIGLFVLGVATGGWDVAMNVQGTVVERRLGRSLLSRLHAGFSAGTVAGGLVGALMVALRVPVAGHLAAVAALVAAAVPALARRFVADRDGVDRAGSGGPADPAGAGRLAAFRAWRERRTVLIGCFVLAFTFAEGVGSDWIGVAAIDGHGAAPSVATLTFGTFLAAMTAGRWFGPGLLDRFGRVRVIRTLALIGGAGVVLFVYAPATPLVFAGAVLWGLGVSLGFPVGMSAAADRPEAAPGRVGVVSSIGYCAFLAGPPAIGFLGEQVTVLRALTTVAVLFGLAALCGAVIAPRTPATADADLNKIP